METKTGLLNIGLSLISCPQRRHKINANVGNHVILFASGLSMSTLYCDIMSLLCDCSAAPKRAKRWLTLTAYWLGESDRLCPPALVTPQQRILSGSISCHVPLRDGHSCLRPKYPRGNQPKQGDTIHHDSHRLPLPPLAALFSPAPLISHCPFPLWGGGTTPRGGKNYFWL